MLDRFGLLAAVFRNPALRRLEGAYLSLPVVVALVGRGVVTGDRLDVGRSADLRLLRGVPMLAPLSGSVPRAAGLGHRCSDQPAGMTVVREGDPGDRFFVVAKAILDVAVTDVTFGAWLWATDSVRSRSSATCHERRRSRRSTR